MGYTAAVINGVRDVLKAATVSGEPLDYLQEVFLAGPSAGSQGLNPFLVVRLPREPYANDSWGGTSNLKNGRFVVEVDVVAEVNPEGNYPFGVPGDPAQRGILTIADDVMDLLEVEAAAIKASSPRVVDFVVSASAYERIAEGAIQVVSVVRIDFQVRFFAGNR